MISWLSRNKTNVSLNKMEAEYIATCLASSEVVWPHKFLVGLFDAQMDATDIYCDNQSYINLTENLMFHYKSKHIEIKYHYTQDMV